MLALAGNATVVHAADLTWGVAGDGVWDTTTANWSGGATTFTDGGVDNVTFDNAAGGTITIDPLMTPLSTTVNTPEGTTYTLVERDSNSGVAMIGGGSLVKDGLGMLELGDDALPSWGDNAYTNDFTAVSVNAGTLKYRGRQAFGTAVVTMAGDTTLLQHRQEGNGPGVAVSNAFVLSGGNVNVRVNWDDKDIWLSGEVSGSGGWSLSGGGRGFALAGDNSFTGGMVVTNSNARLVISHVNALGTGTLTWEQKNAGWLGLNAQSDLGGDETYPDGVPNAIVIAEDAILGVYGDRNLQLSGVISGDTGSIKKRHNSTLTLSGANTYAGGTIVESGTLTVNGSLADSTMSIDTVVTSWGGGNSPGVVNGTGTLNFNIDGTTCDLIQVVNGGTLDITALNVTVNAANVSESAYVIADWDVEAGEGEPDYEPGILLGSEFASIPAGWTADYNYLSDSQIALIPEPSLPGDANGSGFVDDDDLAILLSNWEQDAGTITTWALGDFTADTDVDDDDLAVLLGNWTGPPPGGAAVPEPATLALLALGGLSVLRRRRK